MSRHQVSKQRSLSKRRLFEFLESRQLLSGTPLPITLLGNNAAITNGEISPTFSNATDFRYVSTTASNTLGNITRTYTLTNTDVASLDLTGITISGTNAADFTIAAPFGLTTLAPNQSTTFTIQFTPAGNGQRNATISIASPNAALAPFTFAVDGTGIATTNLSNGLQIGTIQTGTGAAVAANGDILHITYGGYLLNGTLFDATANHGGTPLALRLDNVAGHPFINNDQNFNSSFDFPVIDGWEQGLQGMKLGESRVLIIPSSLGYGVNGAPPSIPSNATLIFETTLNQLDYSPEIAVVGNNTFISPGATTPNTTDGTDFGILAPNQSSITHNITLFDESSADDINGNPLDGLSFAGLSGITFTGTNAADFSVAKVVGQNGVYAITFQPSGFGLRSAIVHVHSNDLNNPDYTFAIQGNNPLLQISLSANGTPITNGDSTPSANDFTDFLFQSTDPINPVTRTYTITNTGTSAISLSNITIGGANPADFTISTPPGLISLNPNETTTCTVTFSPTGTGIRAALISIPSTASNSPFTFAVDGTGIATTTLPSQVKIATRQAGAGNVSAADGDVIQITYSGSLLTGPTFSGTSAFRLDDAPNHPFLTNDPSAANIKNAYDIAQIDGWEKGLQGIKVGETRILFIPAALAFGSAGNGVVPPNADLLYSVTCTGIAYSPQIGVSGNGAAILPGSSTPNTTDGTDFGTLPSGQTSISHNFSILDNSAADDAFGNIVHGLSFNGSSSFTITGADASDFSVSAVAGQFGVYAVKFQPLALGTRTATVHILSNDPQNPDYSFAVQGINAVSPDLQLSLGTTHFPAAAIATNTNASLTLPLTITNAGTGAPPDSATTDLQIFAHNTSTGVNTLLSSFPTQNVSLAPGAASSPNITVAIPSNLSTGVYSLMALINQTHAVTDFNPSNDSATTGQTFSVFNAFVNLTGTLVSTTIPARIVSHAPVAGTIVLNVNNAGTLPLAKGQQVTVTLIAHNTGTGAETTLVTTPPQSVSALKAGGSQKVTTSIKLPAGLPAGNYSYYARINPIQHLTESSTADNLVTTAPFSLSIVDPDIGGSLGTPKLPANIIAGAPTIYTGTLPVLITNTGTVALPANEHVTVAIIAHNTGTGQDTTLQPAGTKYVVSALPIGHSVTANINLKFAGTLLSAGAYQLEARITPVEPLTETSAGNNLITTNAAHNPITLAPTPPTFDLTGTLTSSSLKSTANGITGKLNLSFRTLGNVPLHANQQIHLQIIAHPAGAPDASTDIILATPLISVASLSPQKPRNLSVNVASATPLRGGTYIIEALILPTPALTETSTANNLLTQNVLMLVSTNPA